MFPRICTSWLPAWSLSVWLAPISKGIKVAYLLHLLSSGIFEGSWNWPGSIIKAHSKFENDKPAMKLMHFTSNLAYNCAQILTALSSVSMTHYILLIPCILLLTKLPGQVTGAVSFLNKNNLGWKRPCELFSPNSSWKSVSHGVRPRSSGLCLVRSGEPPRTALFSFLMVHLNCNVNITFR